MYRPQQHLLRYRIPEKIGSLSRPSLLRMDNSLRMTPGLSHLTVLPMPEVVVLTQPPRATLYYSAATKAPVTAHSKRKGNQGRRKTDRKPVNPKPQVTRVPDPANDD